MRACCFNSASRSAGTQQHSSAYPGSRPVPWRSRAPKAPPPCVNSELTSNPWSEGRILREGALLAHPAQLGSSCGVGVKG